MKAVPSSFATTVGHAAPEAASDAPVHQAAPETANRAPAGNSAGGTYVSVVDVGKGDCILVQAGGAAALIDAGYDATSGSVVAHLQGRGVERLEYLVITHYDQDHIGDLRIMSKAFSIGTLYIPGYEGSDKNYRALMQAIGDAGLRPLRVTDELQLTLGGAHLRIFPSGVAYMPGTKGKEGNDNDVSLVATLVCGSDSYLFAGDLEKDGIDAFLKRGLGTFDVVKMPHHGQKSASTDEFIDAVRPKIAIITDSASDPADKKTLKLLEEAGADTYRTSAHGTVVVQSDGAGSYSVD